jgi:hypothetical protein
MVIINSLHLLYKFPNVRFDLKWKLRVWSSNRNLRFLLEKMPLIIVLKLRTYKNRVEKYQIFFKSIGLA